MAKTAGRARSVEVVEEDANIRRESKEIAVGAARASFFVILCRLFPRETE
jgi:hypothetical protein